jgi:hypothetical protein
LNHEISFRALRSAHLAAFLNRPETTATADLAATFPASEQLNPNVFDFQGQRGKYERESVGMTFCSVQRAPERQRDDAVKKGGDRLFQTNKIICLS